MQTNYNFEESIELTPQEYFEKIKGMKHKSTNEYLDNFFDNCITIANKYRITKQIASLQKVLFCMECVEKEHRLIDLGIDTFVYRDDVDFYIDEIGKKKTRKNQSNLLSCRDMKEKFQMKLLM